MSDKAPELIEQVARAMCIADGLNPDQRIRHVEQWMSYYMPAKKQIAAYIAINKFFNDHATSTALD